MVMINCQVQAQAKIRKITSTICVWQQHCRKPIGLSTLNTYRPTNAVTQSKHLQVNAVLLSNKFCALCSSCHSDIIIIHCYMRRQLRLYSVTIDTKYRHRRVDASSDKRMCWQSNGQTTCCNVQSRCARAIVEMLEWIRLSPHLLPCRLTGANNTVARTVAADGRSNRNGSRDGSETTNYC